MAERKIFNYPSEILIQETIDTFGYSPDKFGPSSAKFVMARCRYCGQEMEIRKGFFNKSGSACHKKCRIEEQKKCSPFKDPKVREKAAQTNLERYGNRQASKSKAIGKKISQTKNTDVSRKKTKKTNLERWGVENVFQSEEIKKRIRNKNIEKYGHSSPLQNEEIQEKTRNTLLKRYNVDNMRKHDEFKNRAMNTFKQKVEEDVEGKYVYTNILRGELFWQEISRPGATLKNVCDGLNVEYEELAKRLSRDEFKDRFRSIYSYPRTQKQNELKRILEERGIKTTCNTRDIISPLELDIYVPARKFAIEFNGSHWHSESCLSPHSARHKHLNKTKRCREKGIRLFHIFENNWDKRKPQILNFIKSILGLNTTKIGARKCQINNDECAWFMDDNHIQGAGFATKKYFNLIYDNDVVASMTASNHHRQNVKGNPVVLNRLCFKDGVNVQGGSSKLFKSFASWAKAEGYDRILSWSDNTWTDGEIYEVLGFSLVKEYGPDYFYWDMKNNCYVSKQSQKKSNTGCPPEITERDWCYEMGLFRLWDAGKKLWEYKIK